MIVRTIWLAALASRLLCFDGVAYADNANVEKKFALPERGFLQMGVPTNWDDQIRQPPQASPPTIAFRARQGKPFEILVTPIWRPRADVPVATTDTIKQSVQRAADGVKSQAVEQT